MKTEPNAPAAPGDRQLPITGEAKRTPVSVVDIDVHHATKVQSDLYPYLPVVYRERYRDYGLPASNYMANNGGMRSMRADSWDVLGFDEAGAKIEQVQAQLLDECRIEVAILTGSTVYPATALADVDYGSALCRAFNDFTLEHWLAADKRLRYAMAIHPQDPVQAAAEIDRIGDQPGVCAVLMNTGAPRPYGQRFYRPIHEACVRHNLPIALHFGMEGTGINGAPTAAGYPSYYIEARLARPSFYQAHLASFVFEGVFEQFPSLKVAMLEAGFSWVPGYLWKMDADWKALRSQTPWVKRPPSEYVLKHVRFATQPMEEPGRDEDLATVVRWMDGEHTLMFASDYPHWDFDHPSNVFTGLPPEAQRRILGENARETFRL